MEIDPVFDPLASLALSVQFPFAVENKSVNTVVLEENPVAPTPFAASALKVPVKEGEPDEKAVDELLLTTVLVKFAPFDPVRLYKLMVFPLGAVRFMIRSFTLG